MKPWIPALVLATPWAAHAQIDNTALECGSGPTYFPRGDHWPVEPPLSSHPVTFLQQEDGAPGISGGQDLDAVLAAANTLSSVQCPGGGTVNVQLAEAARNYEARDRGDEWLCPDESACDSSNCDTRECRLNAVSNIAYFVTSGWDAVADSSTVALTTNLFIPDTGFMITADLEFNAQDFAWRAGGAGCTSGAANCYDVETVALHELGHFLGLNHVMCTDAVMFPHGSGTNVVHSLSQHEIAGLCALYPPRGSPATARAPGEQCYQNSDCPSGTKCIKPAGHDQTSYWGWCAEDCTSDSHCPDGYRCAATENDNEPFCKPGLKGTDDAAGGTIDPDTGVAVDLCQACNDGSQCSSGLCLSDGEGSGICTQGCVNGSLPGGGSSGDCPLDMECVATTQDVFVCFPGGETCGNLDSRSQLNELCYQEAIQGVRSEWFNTCGPDLICFGFLPRCGGMEGACVQYCNATDTPCRDRNMRCCAGVSDGGNCEPPDAARPHGGCFDIGRVGEPCVVAEQSICEEGAGCFNFGDASLSKCYDRCDIDGCVGGGGDECIAFSDGCSNTFALCCEGEAWNRNDKCLPSEDPNLYELGVACRRDEDCNSDQCLSFAGEAACSRYCNEVTGTGCPGDIDVNGDGRTDGGFRCRLISGMGRCWPVNGPAEPPVVADDEPTDGCSCTTTSPASFIGLALWPWLIRVVRSRRRSGARHARGRHGARPTTGGPNRGPAPPGRGGRRRAGRRRRA